MIVFVPVQSKIWNPIKPPHLLDGSQQAAYYALWHNADYKCDQMIISRAGAAISVLLLSADYLSKQKAVEYCADLQVPWLHPGIHCKKLVSIF